MQKTLLPLRNGRSCSFFAVALALFFGLVMTASPASYDPLIVASETTHASIYLEARDLKSGRVIPIRVYLPSGAAPCPVVLFSHGLGGSRDGGAFLGRHWAARGYVSVFLQHPGSDTAVWQERPVRERLKAMQQAASFENLLLRVHDVSAVLDQLQTWNVATNHALTGRLDLQRVGLAGHSFGAVTAQAVGGQKYGSRSFADPRVKAVISMSPSAPRVGSASQAFANVKIPWLLMTGTRDTSIINNTSVESRLAVYPALPLRISRYQLVLDGAQHSVFTERPLPGERESRNPNHHRAILAFSTAFLDTWVGSNTAAKAWLEGAGARSVLAEKDQWEWAHD